MNTINLEQDWDIEKADKFVADMTVAKNAADGKDDAYYSEWKFAARIKNLFRRIREKKQKRSVQ